MNIDKYSGLEIIMLIIVIIGTPLIYANVNDTSISEVSDNHKDNNQGRYDIGVHVGDILIFELTDLKLVNYTEEDWIVDLGIGGEIKYEILGINTYEEDGVEEKIEGIHILETTENGIYDETIIYYGSAIPYDPSPIVNHLNWSSIESDLLKYKNILLENYAAIDPIVEFTNGERFQVNYSFSQNQNELNITVIGSSEYNKFTGIRESHTYNLSKSFVNGDFWSIETKLELKSYMKGNQDSLGLLPVPLVMMLLSLSLIIIIRRK